jgi:hypothetical protein
MITQKTLLERGQHLHRMPYSKIQAFLKEMPWLKYFLEAEEKRNKDFQVLGDGINVQQIYVSGVDYSFLELTPFCDTPKTDCSSRTSLFCGETIYFVNSQGEVAEYKNSSVTYKRKYWLFGEKQEIRKEYSWRAIVRYGAGYGMTIPTMICTVLDQGSPVQYAVSYWSHTNALIVYRDPKGIPLFKSITQQTNEQYQALITEEVQREMDGCGQVS